MHYTHNWLKRNPENNPALSRLLPPEAWAKIQICFQFARGAGALAQDLRLATSERRQRLLALETALAMGDEAKLPPFAIAFSRLAPPRSALLACARDLITSFVQDMLKTRYQDYRDLQDYCQLATLPVARALLIIMTSEEAADKAALSALSATCELLGHIQDAGDDYLHHDRIYLPLDWFAFAQAPLKALAASDTSKPLRLVFDRALDNCDTLLQKAKPLMPSLKNKEARRLALFFTLWAARLSTRLRKRDPLASRVRVGRIGLYMCLLKARINS